MPIPTPTAEETLRAIDLYLKLAYPGDPPLLVRSQIDKLKNSGADLFKSPVLVTDQHSPPTRYALRLGNQYYPHMKLVVELAPSDDRFLYRADTHDRHVCPSPRSPEYAGFCQLMEKNQRLAESIELAWEKASVPTFRAYLRDDLKRRQSGMQI